MEIKKVKIVEEDKKQIIIPLSEYRRMEKQISDLSKKNKKREENLLNGKDCKLEKLYWKHIGNNENVNVFHILIRHNSLTDYIYYLETRLNAVEQENKELKVNEGVLKDIYLQLKNQRRDLHWWQLYQRIKINRMLELIEKRVEWTQYDF